MDREIYHKHGGDERDGGNAENVPFKRKSREDDRLDKSGADSNYLCNRFHFAKHICRDNYLLLARCRNKTDACDSQFTKYYYYQSKEIKGEHCDVSRACKENAEHCADHHKFVGKGIEEFTKVGYKVIFSRDLAVKHIGKGRRDKEECADYGEYRVCRCTKAYKRREEHYDHKYRNHNKTKH